MFKMLNYAFIVVHSNEHCGLWLLLHVLLFSKVFAADFVSNIALNTGEKLFCHLLNQNNPINCILRGGFQHIS